MKHPFFSLTDLIIEVFARESNGELDSRLLRIHGDYIQEENRSGLVLEQWFLHSVEACEAFAAKDTAGVKVVALEFTSKNR